MREYGLDLRHEYRTSPARRLWVLVKGLSADSATWSGEQRWTQQTEFLAELIEMQDIASRRVVAALGARITDKPLQIDRPESEREETRAATPEEIAAFFKGMTR